MEGRRRRRCRDSAYGAKVAKDLFIWCHGYDEYDALVMDTMGIDRQTAQYTWDLPQPVSYDPPSMGLSPPAIYISPSATQQEPVLTPDSDASSICSAECDEKVCNDCCDKDECLEECDETCLEDVDCKKVICTSSDCKETGCRQDSPPCFDAKCLEGNVGVGGSNFFSAGVDPSELSWAEPPLQLYPPYITQHAPTTSSVSRSPFQDGPICHERPIKKRRIAHEDHLSNQHLQKVDPTKHVGEDQELTAALQCHWNGICDGQSFIDWGSLENHVFKDHVQPQSKEFQSQSPIPCGWDNCEQPTDPTTIFTHVEENHHVDHDLHTCLWQDCTACFTDCEDLRRHLQNDHVHLPKPELQCQWKNCGLDAENIESLNEHLHTAHYSTTATFDETLNISKLFAARSCEWVIHVDSTSGKKKVCGAVLDGALALQQHAKEAHIDRLRKKIGFECRWNGCSRYGMKPFSQKGKLDRHLQVHTGCKHNLPIPSTRFIHFMPFLFVVILLYLAARFIPSMK